jgi:pimeloyl-ACP methyl ester carboxylesterase
MECKLEGITVNYKVVGEGIPIVILHGWPLDHRGIAGSMESIFKNRDGWKRIYPDLPGMGETPGVDWITNQDQVLDIVSNFINRVIPEQRFVVAGQSYGGYLARGLVYRRSRSMDGLFLLVPGGFPAAQQILPPHVTLVKDPQLISELETKEGAEAAERFQAFAVVQSQEVAQARRADLLPGQELANREFLSRLRENYAFSFDVDALQEPFPGPTLIMTGRQDSACGYYGAWGILENYPRGTFAVLDRAGHMLQYEQRDLFDALVNEWLDRVEEFRAV